MPAFWKKNKTPSNPSPAGGAGPKFAFVLLERPELPSVFSVIESYAEYAAHPEELDVDATLAEAADGGDEDGDGLSIQFEDGSHVVATVVPIPIPNGEAESAASCSIVNRGAPDIGGTHTAHMIVVMSPVPGTSRVAILHRFTNVLAAIADASEAVAIYWGDAGATHPRAFFCQTAAEREIVPRILLWSGVSVAGAGRDAISILSRGMEQLGLPNLLLETKMPIGEALQAHYDLLSYVTDRGKPIPAGETVGRTAEERSKVKYVKSPADPSEQVWRVVL